MDYPYEVPKNWEWIRLPDLCEYIRAGGDKPQQISNTMTGKYNIPVVANGIQNDGIVGYTNIENEKAGTITISGRGTIGHAILRNYIYFPIVRLIVIAPKKSIVPMYMKYIFDNFEEKGIGSSIPQLTIPSLKKKIIPLAPLPEQHRIVERIESLFLKLDEAREKAQSVIDGFENRRAAILHKAFTGNLTKEWREENLGNYDLDEWHKYENGLIQPDENIIHLPATWKWLKLGTLGYSNIGLTYHPNDKSETGTIVLRSSNIQNGKMNYDDIIKVSINIPQSKMCQKGDLLICARNGSKSLVGKTAIIDKDGMSFGAFMAIFRSVYNPYVYHFLCSPFFRNLIDKDVGTTTINQVTQSIIKNLPIPFAPSNEQLEIVHRIDSLLAKEQQAKQTAKAVIEQIDIMKKSILARAFRGELGTNDPNDEPARS